MEIRLSGHSAYRTEYHLVWIPKYRRCILNPGLRGVLKKTFSKDYKKSPRMRDHRIQYPGKSHPYGDDHTTQT
ncbi:hypothetical protein ES708_11855 [subsurface metagenome]